MMDLVMNMIQRQLGLIPTVVRKEDKGVYIQSLVDSRENDNSTVTQDVMLRHHIANLNRRMLEYQDSLMKDFCFCNRRNYYHGYKVS